jgi:hypothetical protein
MDWWFGKLFDMLSTTLDVKFAREFMLKICFCNSEDFLVSWPFWCPVNAKIYSFLGPLGKLGDCRICD